jgi:SAM-dependent methyltransferase
MKRAWLTHLVHPDTQEPLALEPGGAEGDDILDGRLAAGDESFPIENGVPRFVSPDVAGDQTVRSFAQKWDKHRYYRAHTADFYTQWYIDRYGLAESGGLRGLLDGACFVLDAGTGAGRDSANFAENSDATVFGVDTSFEALSAFREQEVGKRVALVNADVNRLPFPDEFFDFVNCDQVIHHTPDPPTTFANLKKKLKTGGQICCYVYKKKAVIREFVDDYVRDRIADKPIDEALAICEGFTKLGRAFAGLKATVTIEEDIPILGIDKGEIDVQRFLHWNVMKCFWNDDFDYFTNNIINFDWYHPKYCFRYEPEEFRAWFANGWEILHWDVQDAGISCRARKT